MAEALGNAAGVEGVDGFGVVWLQTWMVCMTAPGVDKSD
jgi:hypothetical protein